MKCLWMKFIFLPLTYMQIISTFKKENFGLKLRIYFLEERLQMAYEGDTEDILKTVSDARPRNILSA